MGALVLAIASALCFGIALVTGRVGLRSLDVRAGAAISVPSAAGLFLLAAPFAIDLDEARLLAIVVFVTVGAFFPGVVTLLTFRSNELLGPTTTSAVSATAPLFAIVGAGLLLGEQIPAQAAVSAAGVVAGVALLSWRGTAQQRFVGWTLVLPIAGAVLRAMAQVGAKAGLLIWANPFAAGLIGYVVSAALLISVDRNSRTRPRSVTRTGAAWFAATGVLNGSAVLLMYAALTQAPVWRVAPVIAAYPLVTAVLGAATLREESFSLRAAAGAALTVAGVIYLVASPG